VTGLEAISANNGWAIAAVGISIVFTGLTLLSLIISQLHKVLKLWDERGEIYQRLTQGQEKDEEILQDIRLSHDLEESARHFGLLATRAGDPFSLPKLLDLSVKCGLIRPHATLNYLILKKQIVPDGNGYFIWDSEKR